MISIIRLLISLYVWVIIAAALVSWFPSNNPSGGLATTKRILHDLTEPVLRPVRQIMPKPRFGGVGVDLSALVVIVVLNLVARLI